MHTAQSATISQDAIAPGTSKVRVGFVGLGMMGLPMASLLADSGFEVIVYDISPERQAAARASGRLGIAPSLRAVVETAQIILTCLPTDISVREVYLGVEGIGVASRPGLITIDCSTVSPRLAVEIAKTLEGRQIRHVEATIIGRPVHAETGQLYFVVAGPPVVVAEVELLLTPLARGWRYVGAAGMASRVKLLQNALGYCSAVATTEVLGVCRAAGVDTDAFIEIVNEAGGIGGSTYFREYASYIARAKDGGTGRLRVAAKDTELIVELTAEAGINAPALLEAGRVFSAAAAHDWGDDEHTAIWRLLEAHVGRKLFG